MGLAWRCFLDFTRVHPSAAGGKSAREPGAGGMTTKERNFGLGGSTGAAHGEGPSMPGTTTMDLRRAPSTTMSSGRTGGLGGRTTGPGEGRELGPRKAMDAADLGRSASRGRATGSPRQI